MTCTNVRRMHGKVETPAKPRNGRIVIGVLLAVLLVCVAIGVALHLRNVEIEQQTQVQLRDDFVAELERNEGTYDAQSIVLYKTSRAKAEELAEKLGASLRMTKDGSFATLTLPEGTTILDVCREEENIAYIEQMSADYQVSISELIEEEEDEDEQDTTRLPMRPTYTVRDTDYSKQTYLDYMNMQNVWASYKGYGITIAVIDTGIDTDHPEFAGRISEYSYNATEDKIVKDYVLENGEYDWSLVEDEQGHGTAVTGVIAASMNSGHVVGIAPDVTIITIKAECNEDGTFKRTSDLVFGLYYAIERDVSVVNMSFGTYDMDNPFAEATQLAYDSDVICVAAAGNDATATLTWPAADPLVIGVGALADGSWELAEYSNYGENVNVVAPGTTYTSLMGGGYGSMDGTSLACPAVTGLIALYMQTHKYVMFDQVTEELYASCYDLGDLGRDWYFGFGAVDANAFLIEERGTITYDMLTDEVDDMEGTFIRGHALQELPVPDRLYAIFDGWYYDEHCTQRVEYYTDAFYGDLTLYANWVNEDDGIPYTYVILEDGTVEIRSYTGHRRYITIPEKIEGRIVSSIGDFAFQGETNLREVGLPSGLRHIGLSAFSGCSNLVGVYIPENVTEIEDSAFAECVRLSTIAFTGQSKLLTIGDYAFKACGKLRTIELPASLQSINGTAFVGTSSLTAIRVQNGNQYFKSEDGVLFDIGGETLVAYPAAHGTTYEIPESVKTVGDFAFYGAKVIFLDFGQIQTIGKYAFESSSVLTVNIPDSVTFMGKSAFAGSKVRELTIGAGLAEIAEGAFSSCTSLQSVHIPEGIVVIGWNGFSECGLRSVTFAENSRLQSIGGDAFSQCCLTEIDIPASVIRIENGGCGAFGANPLTRVRFDEGSQLQYIGNSAFDGCDQLYDIVLPENVITIGIRAFYSCVSLLKINLPEGLRTIHSQAFANSGLTSVMLPSSLTFLGEGAFGWCTALPAIEVAEGNAVYHDVDGVVYNLADTEVHAFPAGRGGNYTTLETTRRIMPYSFAGTINLNRVTMLEGVIEIGEYAFSQCGAYTYDLPSTLRYIKANGFERNSRLNSITLPEGLEQIAEKAFYDCSVLPTIHIPDSVLQIGRYAFAKDWNLHSVTFNETAKLPRISFGAFAYCGLQSFRVPANVSTIAQEAFEGCSYLTSITFAKNSKLESISAYMFDGCSNLQTITFEQGSALTSIQAHGLEGMDKLTTINWGDAKVTNIDNFAFRFCESLSNLTLPDTVTNVGRYAFYGCKSLSELTLPAQVEHIGMFAFLGTNDLDLYFKADVIPTYLDEDWDHGIRGYYVGVTNVVTDGDYKYATLTSGDVSIIEYLGSDTEIDLSVLDFGAPIMGIGGSAFEDKGITRIVLPDTLTNIQAEAFAYNPLQEITIPAGVTFVGREAFTYTEIASLTFAEGSQIKTIEQYAFEKTENLTEVTLPASLTTMGRGVFHLSGLTSVTFEEGIALERIPENAFTQTKLTSIALPDGVNYVDHNAFREIPTLQSVTFGNAENISLQSNSFYHTGLTSLHIPANVTYIGEYSFVALSNLTEITVDENNPWYKSEDGLLLSKDGRKLIVVPAGRTGSLTVPASVEMLGFGAFEETKLSEVKFDPNANILTLGYRAFFKANNLTSIDIPKSVISIDYYAFAYCENLQTVNFAEDNQLKGIYEGAFCGDIRLENITIPNTIVEISDFAFYGCSKLDRIPISENGIVKGIYSYAFAYTGISGEFTTPETLIDIGDYAFMGTKITKLTVPDTNQWDLVIGIGAFEDCYKLEEVTLPFIGASLDNEQYSWFGYVFGAGSYKANATYVPESLKTVTIAEGQTIVGRGGFAYLTELETINVPHSICTLYDDAFRETTARYELTNTILTNSAWITSGHLGKGIVGHLELAGPGVFENNQWYDGITRISFDTFESCNGLTSIVIPGSVPSVQFANCLNLTDITVLSGVNNVSVQNCPELTSISLPNSVTQLTVAQCANLKHIDIPDNVIMLSVDSCQSLTSIEIPDEVINLKISDCIGITDVDIPHTVTSLDLSGCTNLREVDIPNGVTSLNFSGCTGLTSVQIPDGIRVIGREAFANCIGLKEIIIPDQVNKIDSYAFTGCNGLVKVIIPDGVKIIGDGAFANCLGLNTVIIGDGVTSIGKLAFGGCSALAKVVIGKSVKHIEFGYDPSFMTTRLHYVENNSDCVFEFGLQGQSYVKIVIDKNGNISNPDNIRQYKKTNDGFVYGVESGRYYLYSYVGDKNTITLPKNLEGSSYTLVNFSSTATNIVIPNGTQTIKEYSFSGCTGLESITIPDSVTVIEQHAFSSCTKLTNIKIPARVNTISRGAFQGCTSLESITIPSSVYEISDDAFEYCKNLTSVTLSEGLAIISRGAFNGCTSLESITIPSSVYEIGDTAFQSCKNLTSVTLSEGLAIIGNAAFLGCDHLKQINIPKSVSSIGDLAFSESTKVVFPTTSREFIVIDNVLYDYPPTHLIQILDRNMEEICIPEGVTTIRGGAFAEMENLKRITIPGSVEYIDSTAFYNCVNLETVIIGEGVKQIRYGAFEGCVSLTSIKIPNSVELIASYAFSNCTNLKNIELGTGLQTIEDCAFADCVSLTHITIPKNVQTISLSAFSSCYALSKINVVQGNAQYASIGGALYNKQLTEIYHVPCGVTGEFVIPDGVITIGKNAFANCNQIESIIISSSVKTIKQNAFFGCESLTRIEIPDSVTSIDSNAFANCISLKSVALPSSLTEIQYSLFEWCYQLCDVKIPDSVTTIRSDAFSHTALRSIHLPKNVSSIGDNAFYSTPLRIVINDSRLKLNIGTSNHGCIAQNALIIVNRDGSVSAPDNYSGVGNIEAVKKTNGFIYIKTTEGKYYLVAYIGASETIVLPRKIEDADYSITYFYSNAKHVIIPEGITSIGSYAFYGCSKLTRITIPNTVTSIGSYAFGACSNLTSVNIPNSVTNIDNNIFYGCDKLSWDEQSSYVIVDEILMSVDSDTKYIPIDTIRVVAEGAYAKASKLKLALWNGSLEYAQNVETLVVTNISKSLRNCPITLKNIVITGDIDSNTLRNNLDFFKDVTGVIIFVDANEKDLKWDDNYPGWNNGNRVIYSDQWSWITFYDHQGYVLLKEPRLNEEIIRLPIYERAGTLAVSYLFSGWDLDGDEKINSVPAVTDNDLVASPVFVTIPNEYVITFKDGATGEVYEQYIAYYGDLIVLPSAPIRDDGYLIDWEGYTTGMTVTTHVEFYANWHFHEYTVVKIVPTCTEIGCTAHICSCGDKWSEDYIEALGHNYDTEWSVDVAPTCTEAGSKSHHCTRCDDKLDITEIPATGHSHTATVTAPTCIGKGFTSYYCHCTDFYIGDYVDALGHTEAIDEAVAPTCTATGLTEGKHCSVCHAVLVAQEVVPANGHTYESVVTDPTCTEKGYTTHTCHCGDSYVDSEVDALGHTPSDWIVDAEAQIGVEGSKHKECTVCGETLETEVIEALTEAPTTETPTTEASETEPSGGCNGTISVSVALIALLSCFAVAWRPRKDN